MPLLVRKAAVLGAGVMGAQIAAHLANANVRVILFDLRADGPEPDAIVDRAIERLKKMEPSPLVVGERWREIERGNYEQHAAQLETCDLIVEAIAEKLETKLELYAKLAPHLNGRAIFATNTSGLSIETLAQSLPVAQRPRFCGVHFFNPPRYMRLVELIPSSLTQADVLDGLETFLTTTLGKGVIRAHDTPNFVANRIGVFAMLAAMHHAERCGLGFDTVDALTGGLIERPRSATFGTLDLIGLDTFDHILASIDQSLRSDPWHAHFQSSAWSRTLIERGALGRKSSRGIYWNDKSESRVFDAATNDYRPVEPKLDEHVTAILRLDEPEKKFTALRESSRPHAQFLWAVFRDTFHYSATHLEEIADTARDVDFAMRWGFGWRRGPFETWQAGGWSAIAEAIRRDIDAGLTMAGVPLPDWVFDGRRGVQTAEGSFSPRARRFIPRTSLPVYVKQLFPERVLGEAGDPGTTLFENGGTRLWHSNESGGSDVGILSFKTKLNTISAEVLDGIVEAVSRAERDCLGLVIWQPAPPFSAGADLKAMLGAAQAGKFEKLDSFINAFQQMTRRLKYAQIPVVAAIDGPALGGGCEIALHCARVVATVESRIGLVEASVGLIPGGGGCKEQVVRMAQLAADAPLDALLGLLQPVHRKLSRAETARTGSEAREAGFLREGDSVIFHPAELLYVAKQIARTLNGSGYRPAFPPRTVRVAGRAGITAFETFFEESGALSEHDRLIARAIATTLSGGEVEAGAFVDEAWLLDVERAAFMDLIRTDKTQQRIAYMLERGKPLRN